MQNALQQSEKSIKSLKQEIKGKLNSERCNIERMNELRMFDDIK